MEDPRDPPFILLRKCDTMADNNVHLISIYGNKRNVLYDENTKLLIIHDLITELSYTLYPYPDDIYIPGIAHSIQHDEYWENFRTVHQMQQVVTMDPDKATEHEKLARAYKKFNNVFVVGNPDYIDDIIEWANFSTMTENVIAYPIVYPRHFYGKEYTNAKIKNEQLLSICDKMVILDFVYEGVTLSQHDEVQRLITLRDSVFTQVKIERERYELDR